MWSCEPRVYRCKVAEIPALAKMDPGALQELDISSNGSRIHWAAGDLVGLKQPYLARVESGRQQPKLKTLERIARAAGSKLEVRFVELRSS